MAIDIMHILESGLPLKGDDLGRLLIEDSAQGYQRFRNGEKGLDDDLVDRRLILSHQSLRNEEQRQTFFRYVQMNNWMERYRLHCEAHMQQCQVRYEVLLDFMLEAKRGEALQRLLLKVGHLLPADDDDLRAANSIATWIPPLVVRPDQTASDDRKADAGAYITMAKSTYSVFLRSYYFVEGYNYAIDRIATLHGLDCVRIYQRGLHLLDGEVEELNGFIGEVDALLTAPHPDPDGQLMKLSAFRRLFPPIDSKKVIALRKKHLKRIDRLISSFEGFGEPGVGGGPKADLLMRLLYFPDQNELTQLLYPTARKEVR